jgi:hypothetical protein
MLNCPGGCGVTVGVDGEGFLTYCEDCEQQREGIKQAYWRLACQIMEVK